MPSSAWRAPARSATARSSSRRWSAWCASVPAIWTTPRSENRLLNHRAQGADLGAGASRFDQAGQQGAGVGMALDQRHLPFAHEAALHAGSEEGQQVVVIAGGVEQADGLVVVAQLAPGPDFEQFLERAD